MDGHLYIASEGESTVPDRCAHHDGTTGKGSRFVSDLDTVRRVVDDVVREDFQVYAVMAWTRKDCTSLMQIVEKPSAGVVETLRGGAVIQRVKLRRVLVNREV